MLIVPPPSWLAFAYGERSIKSAQEKPGIPQADTVSLTIQTLHTSFETSTASSQMDSFFPVANPIPAEETQVPVDFDGSGTPGSGNQCTIA